MTAEIRLLIVDDQQLTRIGLRQIVESEPGLAVVGEASNGIEAIKEIREHHPDVVLMDIRMPSLDGIGATAAIMTDESINQKPRIVIVTTFDHDDYVFGALRAGAAGFVLKDSDPVDILRAIHVVFAGESLIAPELTRRLIESALRNRTARPAHHREIQTLTDREREVLVLLAQGLSNVELSEHLFLSESTVKTHITKVLLKLHLRSRVQATIFAYESGLVQVGTAQRNVRSRGRFGCELRP